MKESWWVMKLVSLSWGADRGWSAPLPAVDSPSTLVLVFGDEVLAADARPLADLDESYPNSVIVGCSTSGQILGPAVHDGGCVVAIAQFERVELRTAAADVQAGADSFEAGAAIGRELAGPALRSLFVLSDGLNVNGSELVAGLVANVGAEVVVTGGLAGDGDRFERTWVIERGGLASERVVAVGLYGDHVRIGSGSQGGWGIFGPERVVTRSHSNVLYELDGRPALELYKRYLGDLASELPASALLFPLAIRSVAHGAQLVRTVLAVDESNQSMTFAGDIPQGCRAQLMRSNADRLVDGAASAAMMSCDELEPVGPSLTIAISCVGRRLVLGARIDDELEATCDALPAGSELVGFYSYGEIAPGAGGFADLHNQTMTVTSIFEV